VFENENLGLRPADRLSTVTYQKCNYNLAPYLGDNLAHDRKEVFHFYFDTTNVVNQVVLYTAKQPTKLYNLRIKVKNFSNSAGSIPDILEFFLLIIKDGNNPQGITYSPVNGVLELYRPNSQVWWFTKIYSSDITGSTTGAAFQMNNKRSNITEYGYDGAAALSRNLHVGDTLWLCMLETRAINPIMTSGIAEFYISTDNK